MAIPIFHVLWGYGKCKNNFVLTLFKLYTHTHTDIQTKHIKKVQYKTKGRKKNITGNIKRN